MTINGGIFVLQQVYNKQVSKTWIENFSIYLPESFGWFAGGATPSPATISSIERYSHTNDTSNTEIRNNLSKTVRDFSATSNPNYGWFYGGFRISPSVAVVSDVERLTFTDDTSSLSQRGNLSVISQSMGVSGNEFYGWLSGGSTGSPGGTRSSIQRNEYSSDTSTALVRGNLTTTLERHGGTGNQDYGWFFGGLINPFVPGPSFPSQQLSTIQRITYSNDTSTASLRGPLDIIRWSGCEGVSTDEFGWVAGGSGPSTTLSSICRINFNSDTQTASVRGSLTAVSTTMSYTNDLTYGWFTLGSSSSGINRIEFLNDTVNATGRSFLQIITILTASATGTT
jgi:hypothetical protein